MKIQKKIILLSLIIILIIGNKSLALETNNIEKEVKNLNPHVTTAEGIEKNLEDKNNKLKFLKVEGYEIYPKFNKNINEYYVIVKEDVEKINIVAEKEELRSTLKGDGIFKINSKKENVVEIKVKSKIGVNNIYKINIIKEKKSELYLTNLEIEDIEINPKFQSNRFFYEIIAKRLDEKPLNIVAISNNKEAKIEIIGNKDLKFGNNKILIILQDKNNRTIYQFDVKLRKQILIIDSNELEKNKYGKYIVDFFSNRRNCVIYFIVLYGLLELILIIILIKKIIEIKAKRKQEDLRDRAKKL